MEHISQTSHRNLVKLLGYCEDDKELVLVYEYIPNGNLRQHLRPSSQDSCGASEQLHPTLTFEQRIDIAVGAAEGLRYLHNFSTPSIIHRDIKCDNVLLDDAYEVSLLPIQMDVLALLCSGGPS